MAETKVIEEAVVAAPEAKEAPKKTTRKPSAKKAAPKAKAPRVAKPKAAAKPQLTKEDVQAAMYEAVKTALLEVKAAEAPKEIRQEEKVEIKPIVKEEIKPVVKEFKKLTVSKTERLLSILAYIYLCLGLLTSFALVVVGAVMEFTQDSFFKDYMDGTVEGYYLLIGGVVLLLPTLLQFSLLQLFANISHRLSSLDSKK